MRRRLLCAMLTLVMLLAICPTALAYNPSVPGEAVTMAGDSNTVAVVDTNHNLWVYHFTFINGSTSEYFGYEKPEVFDTNVASVSVSDSHIAYIKTDGSLWICGSNLNGAAGNGERGVVLSKPAKIMDNVIAVSAGYHCTAAIRADHSLWLWGSLPGQNPFGYDFCGTQTPFKAADDVVAVSLVGDTNPGQISTDYGVFLKKDGSLWGWGSNNGHVLYRDYFAGLTPTDYPVKLMDNVASFATGDSQCAAVTKNGDLYVWGNNYFGSLGFPMTSDSRQGEYQLGPKKVLSNVAKVAIANGDGCTVFAIKNDGSLWGAGHSDCGELGAANSDTAFVPQYIKLMDGVTNIATVTMGVYVTKTDGSLWAWGKNQGGGTHDLLAIKQTLEKTIATPVPSSISVKVASPNSITISTQEESAGNPFTDIAYGSYCYDAILWALKNNVTTGTSATTFAPQAVCTRGQVVTFLWRAMGCPEPKTTRNPFEDVKETDYFYKPVLWAYENGITTGVSDTKFGPDGICNEAQIITFLWRTRGEPSADLSVLLEAKRNTYFAKAQAWAYKNGLVSSVNAINEVYYCTRANVATYLYKTFGK